MNARIADLTDELTRVSSISPRPIATGGLADIYRVTRRDGVLLAIKCLRQTGKKNTKRTARELHVWSKLNHENVLNLHGLAVFHDCLAMISPWIANGSVVSVLKTRPNTVDRFQLCKQLVAVIEYIHDNEIVHGDIKGENLLLASDGTLKLTDFGLSILHDPAMQFSETDPGGGTTRWMAPELLIHEDARRCKETDVYAMGMTMLEIITGDVPFREIKLGPKVILAVTQERRTPQVPELQAEPISPRASIMLGALHWCWQFDPEDRAAVAEIGGLMDFMAPM